MKNTLSKAALALSLSFVMLVSGCSTTWVTTLDSILAAAAPALINILNIVAIAEGKPVNAALVSKVNADSAAIKSLATDFSTASAAAAPAVCSQLQAAITTYQADQATILSVAQVSNSATQAKIEVLSALVAGTVSAILAVIPSCQAPASLKLSAAPPLPLKQFIGAYNTNLVKPTGLAGVDAYTKSHKLSSHGKLVHALSLGMVN